MNAHYAASQGFINWLEKHLILLTPKNIGSYQVQYLETCFNADSPVKCHPAEY